MRKRTGTFIMLAGVALAFVAGLMVLAITRQAAAQSTAQVKQVLVVMAARDIPEGTPVSADALTVPAINAGRGRSCRTGTGESGEVAGA